jgi:hypothetical protein
VTLSRTRSGWQPLEPIGHDVLGLLIDRGMCFKVISIAEILGQHSACFNPSMAQDGHIDDKDDQKAACLSEIHLLFFGQNKWRRLERFCNVFDSLIRAFS